MVTKEKGIPSYIKVLACFRVLASGGSFGSVDESGRIAAETLRKYFYKFLVDIKELYGDMFFNRLPSTEELERVEEEYASKGFNGCVGAADCRKVWWKNRPASWKGQYHNTKEERPGTIVAEAWCDNSLYIWHWFFGMPGTKNDKKILDNSPLCERISSGHFNFDLRNDFRIQRNGAWRRSCYMLVDEMYPNWAIFSKPIPNPTTPAESAYSVRQEARREDIERCFGVLEARFQVLRRENNFWHIERIIDLTHCCVILHNLLVSLHQKGVFDDEVREEEGLEVVSELYDEERAERNIRKNEKKRGVSRGTGRYERMSESDVRLFFENMQMTESSITSYSGHMELRSDLIQSSVENMRLHSPPSS